MKITIENADVGKVCEIITKLSNTFAPTIEVKVTGNDELKSPIVLDGTKITQLGIYEIKGIKYWIVKQ